MRVPAKDNSRLRRIGAVVGVGLLLVGGVWACACTRSSTTASQAPQPLPVQPQAMAPAPSTQIATQAATSIAAAAAACAAEPFPTKGTIHYVCDCDKGADKDCVAGSDAADGRSKAKAWKTWAKGIAAASSMKAGDTLAFCKGGLFTNQDNPPIWSPACSAAKPCVIRDYVPTWASGDEAAPIVNVLGDNSAFNFTNLGDATHDEGYRVLNIDAEGGGAGSGATLGNDVKDVTFCNMTFNGFHLGFYVSNANKPAPGSDDKSARIALRGSRITNNSQMGYLGACSGCAIEYNYFEHNGGDDPSDHAIYMERSETQDQAGNQVRRIRPMARPSSGTRSKTRGRPGRSATASRSSCTASTRT